MGWDLMLGVWLGSRLVIWVLFNVWGTGRTGSSYKMTARTPVPYSNQVTKRLSIPMPLVPMGSWSSHQDGFDIYKQVK